MNSHRFAVPHVEQFKHEGYTTVPHFFSPVETKALQLEVRRWVAEGLPRDVSTEPSKRQNLQLIPLHPRSKLLRALPFSGKVIRAIESLIGKPAIKILDQMFYKPPRSGMGTSWHTDNAYFRLDDALRGTAMWIAVHDADKANGALKVIPGVFRQDFPHERDIQSDHHIRFYPDETNTVHCELEAGGVVFFCFGTPHATGSNRTDRARAGIGLHFVNSGYLDAPHADRWEKVQLSVPGNTQGRREYGATCDFDAEVRTVVAR